jgi:hypothetical protein
MSFKSSGFHFRDSQEIAHLGVVVTTDVTKSTTTPGQASGRPTCGRHKTLSGRPDAFHRRPDNSATKTKTPPNPRPKAVQGRKQLRSLLDNIQPRAAALLSLATSNALPQSFKSFGPMLYPDRAVVRHQRAIYQRQREATVYEASLEQPTLAVFRVAVNQQP